MGSITGTSEVCNTGVLGTNVFETDGVAGIITGMDSARGFAASSGTADADAGGLCSGKVEGR